MTRLLPGAIVGVLALGALGCGTSGRMRRLPSSVFHAARMEARASARRPPARGDEGAALVERALHQAGLRFGTDGSTRALWGYMRTSHTLVRPAEARAGDVLFFDLRGTGPQPACADHAGIVERVDADGRISFIEARGGQIRHSFVDPAAPTVRRGPGGQVLNTFLRTKAITDPDDARYFAGEMLCAVGRVTHR